MKKLSKKFLLLIGLSSLGSSVVMAQQNPDNIWTLEEAVNYATTHNLQVRQSMVNKQVNETYLKQSKFNLLPSVNANASHSYVFGTNRDPLTYEFLNAERIRSNNFSASASVPLFMGFQQQNTIKQNRLEVEASEQDVLSAKNDIIIQVITSYLNILFADELLKTNQLQRNSTQEQLDRTQILFDAGSIAENEVLDLQSQLATDELNIINAQNQRDIAQLNLIQLLNLENPENFQIEIPELPDPDAADIIPNPEQVYDIAVQTLPAIKSADLRVLSAAKGLDVARGAYYPRISFNAGVNTGFSTSRSLFLTETIDNGLQRQLIGYLDPAGTDEIVIYVPQIETNRFATDYPFWDQINDNIGKQLTFSMSVPVFNGLQARMGVERAKLSQVNAKINADIARNNLRQTIEQAAVDALAAKRQYIAANKQLVASEKNFRNAQLRLNAGVINTVDFTIIANAYRSAQSSVLQAKYEYIFKQKVLDFYQGKDLSF